MQWINQLSSLGRWTEGGAFSADAFVAGTWQSDTSGGVQRRLSPHTGREASIAAVCGEEEVLAARRYASTSAREIRSQPAYRRAEMLERAASLLLERREELARLEKIGRASWRERV